MRSIRHSVFFCIAVVFAAGQSEQFEHFGVEQGLSQASVMCILQDREGYLWLGTWDGLNRYDGYSFRQYHYDPFDSTSLSNNSITRMAEDASGDLWLATAQGGVVLYERKNDAFRRDFIDERTNRSMRIPYVQNLHTRDHRTIIAQYEADLYIIDAASRRVRHVNVDTIVSHSFTREEVRGAELLVAMRRLVALMPDGTIRIQEMFRDVRTKNRLSGSYRQVELEDGTMLFATGTGGVWRFDWNRQELVPAFVHSNDPQSLSDDAVTTLFRDSRGDVWVATDNGLNRSIRDRNGTITGFRRIMNDATDPKSISHDKVNIIAEDRAGIIWVGTQTGLNKLVPQRKRFISVPSPAKYRSMMNGALPVAFFEENDSTLWIGTSGPLIRYDLRRDTWTSIVPMFDGVPTNRIFNIRKDRRGTVWITTAAGIAQFDLRTHHLAPVRFTAPEEWRTAYSRSYALTEDDDGAVWGATTRGLVRIDPVTLKNERFFFDTVAHGEKNSNLIELYAEGDTVWIGNISRGLIKFRRSDRSHQRFAYQEHDPTSLSYNTPMSIRRDRRGRLWVATLGGGLNEVLSDGNRTAFRRYTTREGLPNDQIYGIVEDDEGMLWLSTNIGLSKFDPVKETFTNYTTRDGLPTQEFNQNAYYRGPSGTVYFGGIAGIVRFRPEEIRIDTLPPPVAVTSFSLFNKERNDLLRTGSIVLTYAQNFFSFEFSALSFEAPEENRHSWKLEGFDKEWSTPGSRRFASYTGVPPGDYTFRVKASNGDGVWNERGASIPIVIVPPFWATWWFRTAFILILIGSIVGIVRYTSYRKYRRQIEQLEQERRILEERQRTRDRIARDLHDDLASTVGSAGLFVETARRTMTNDPSQTEEFLTKASSILNDAEEAMSDIVWSVSPKHDSLQSLTARIRLVTTDLCRANGIASSITVDGDLNVPMTDDLRRGCYLIFKELLANAVKHARASRIDIAVRITPQELTLTVSDNGIGLDLSDTAERKGGNGILNMKKRAEEMNGTISFTSTPGSGTSVSLILQMTQLSH